MFFPLWSTSLPRKSATRSAFWRKCRKKCIWRNEFPMKIAALLTIIHFYVTFLVQKKVNVTLNFCFTIHARVRRRTRLVFPALAGEERDGEWVLWRTDWKGSMCGIRTEAARRLA